MTGSLRLRLLLATLAGLALALALAWVALSGIFRDHVTRQFQATLQVQLDQLTARIEFDAAGRPTLDPATLSDPRWSRPYSGLYWQIDPVFSTPADESSRQSGATHAVAAADSLRSRSLWDTRLALPADTPADGALHAHEVAGPQSSRLLVLERSVRPENGTGAAGAAWRLAVAADRHETDAAVDRFRGVLAQSLAALMLLLALAAWAQVSVGLRPLRALQRGLQALRTGQATRLEGRYPAEVQPLVDDLNGVIERHAAVLERARQQAGNLAHALKTPLTVLDQAASGGPGATEPNALAPLVREQVQAARRHIDWHLARARAAATQGLPGQRTKVAPVIEGLLRVMARVHAGRDLDLSLDAGATPPDFAGEEQDLQEMLGNLIDNACQWARHRVQVRVAKPADARLEIRIEDDGPGIGPGQRDAVLARGVRLDESTPGSGLGLAIVQDLAGLYGGTVALDPSALGGTRVTLVLPAAG